MIIMIKSCPSKKIVVNKRDSKNTCFSLFTGTWINTGKFYLRFEFGFGTNVKSYIHSDIFIKTGPYLDFTSDLAGTNTCQCCILNVKNYSL